jgi:hypothetical protein
MLTEVAVVTLPAVTGNVAELKPCGTFTEEGTLATALFELESETTVPPAPAGDVRLTVPVPDWPLTIAVGLTEMLVRLGSGGFTVRPDAMLAPE